MERNLYVFNDLLISILHCRYYRFCWRAGVRMPIIDSQLHKLILHADFMHSHILIDLLLLNALSLACYKALRISNLELIGFLSGELYVVYCSRTG